MDIEGDIYLKQFIKFPLVTMVTNYMQTNYIEFLESDLR